MYRLLFAVLTGMTLSLNVAYADINDDLAAGLPVKTVLENAVSEGKGLADAVTEIITANASLTCACLAAAKDIDPDQSKAIDDAATKALGAPAQEVCSGAEPGSRGGSGVETGTPGFIPAPGGGGSPS
ncbi:MAG: hypothetical protein DRR06_04075 [Gammaproteobacteria bacterium]|nr:MAG: hypothetical protein DRR06_04075 [Gammaproteobacteria bacterium]RLA54975.1 MAG: hypothetical protein DRR42_00305 [Gammaproteobacteria bacterium]